MGARIPDSTLNEPKKLNQNMALLLKMLILDTTLGISGVFIVRVNSLRKLKGIEKIWVGWSTLGIPDATTTPTILSLHCL